MCAQHKETHCFRPKRQSQRAKTEFPPYKTKSSRKKKLEISPTKNAGVGIAYGHLRTKTIYRKFPDIAEAQERVRATQWVLNTTATITDTAFRVFLGRPRCPHCGKNDLRFSHMMHCKYIGGERQDAENYAHPKSERGNDGPKLNYSSAPAPHQG